MIRFDGRERLAGQWPIHDRDGILYRMDGVLDHLLARVGEGIVSAIGSCASHKEVLANPVLIARTVLNKGLDSQTAYEIVSIDIADIDVGENIGAQLTLRFRGARPHGYAADQRHRPQR